MLLSRLPAGNAARSSRNRCAHRPRAHTRKQGLPAAPQQQQWSIGPSVHQSTATTVPTRHWRAADAVAHNGYRRCSQPPSRVFPCLLPSVRSLIARRPRALAGSRIEDIRDRVTTCAAEPIWKTRCNTAHHHHRPLKHQALRLAGQSEMRLPGMALLLEARPRSGQGQV